MFIFANVRIFGEFMAAVGMNASTNLVSLDASTREVIARVRHMPDLSTVPVAYTVGYISGTLHTYTVQVETTGTPTPRTLVIILQAV